MNLAVEANTVPLLGSDDLLVQEIDQQAERLLDRRGFVLAAGEGAKYSAKLTCKTERDESAEIMLGSKLGFSSTGGLTTTAVTSLGLGVTTARIVGSSREALYEVGAIAKKTVPRYEHTVAIEIKEDAGRAVWKGEATWISSDLDVRGDIVPALQLLFSQLPTTNTVYPKVRVVHSSKKMNFYRLFCYGQWYSCPALPYRITFARNNQRLSPAQGKQVRNSEAYAAYVDLIQTAEYALPSGSNSFSDPFDSRLWRKAKLGGTYILEPGGNKVNIIVKLKGHPEGYLVDRCFIASDLEFEEFQEDLRRWQNALQAYCDVFG